MPESTGLGSVPYVVLGLYLCVLLCFGIQGFRRRQGESTEDYYLAGRAQGWVVSSLTIMATALCRTLCRHADSGRRHPLATALSRSRFF